MHQPVGVKRGRCKLSSPLAGSASAASKARVSSTQPGWVGQATFTTGRPLAATKLAPSKPPGFRRQIAGRARQVPASSAAPTHAKRGAAATATTWRATRASRPTAPPSARRRPASGTGRQGGEQRAFHAQDVQCLRAGFHGVQHRQQLGAAQRRQRGVPQRVQCRPAPARLNNLALRQSAATSSSRHSRPRPARPGFSLAFAGFK